MPDSSKPVLLVAGAAGHLGRRVVELLLEQDAGSIIATSHRPEKLADLSARGVDVRAADLDDPSSLAGAFSGADRMLLISTHAVGRRIAQHRSAIAAAEQAGVRHIVYTSGPSARPAPDAPVLDEHFWTEQALAASTMSWTILRHNIYTDVLLLSLPSAVASGQFVSAAGDGGRSYVTREDCARTDAAALAATSTERLILDVTGPAAVTQDEIAALATELSGRAVAHARLSDAALRQTLVGAGLPPALVDSLLGFDTATRQGYQGMVTSTVKDMTGREPTPVREFLLKHRSLLVPSSAQ